MGIPIGYVWPTIRAWKKLFAYPLRSWFFKGTSIFCELDGLTGGILAEIDEARTYTFRITETYYGSLFVLEGVSECVSFYIFFI